MAWIVKITGKARKQVRLLPEKIAETLNFLLNEIQHHGPAREGWQNYGKLKGKPGFYHCHLNKGKPRYVAVWKESEKGVKLVEVRYVGSHEKADYRKIS